MNRNKSFPRGSGLLLGVYAGILLMLLAARLVHRFAVSAAIVSWVSFILTVATVPLSAMAVLCAIRYPGVPYLCLLGADLLWRIADTLATWSTWNPSLYLSTSPLIRFLFNTLLASLIPLGLTWVLSRGFLRLTRREGAAYFAAALIMQLLGQWYLFPFISEYPLEYLQYILLQMLAGSLASVAVYGVAVLIRRARNKKAVSPAFPDESLGDYLS